MKTEKRICELSVFAKQNRWQGAFPRKKNQFKTLDIYIPARQCDCTEYSSLKNARELTFVAPPHSCPEHGQSRHNQRQWSTMKPAPEYETVRQFNSAITNRLQYLIGSILCALVKNLPLVWMDYVVFSSYSKQENPLFLLFPAKLLNTFWLFKISHQPLQSQICWLCFDDHMKSPIKAGLCSVARILSFSRMIPTGRAANFWRPEPRMHCIILHTV